MIDKQLCSVGESQRIKTCDIWGMTKGRGSRGEGVTFLCNLVRFEFSTTTMLYFGVAFAYFIFKMNQRSLGRENRNGELVQGLSILSEETDPLTTAVLGPTHPGRVSKARLGPPPQCPDSPAASRAPERGAGKQLKCHISLASSLSHRSHNNSLEVGRGESLLEKPVGRSHRLALHSHPLGA